MFILFFFPFVVFREKFNLAENLQIAIMIEVSTEEVLYKKNSNERLVPASMTKIVG